MTGSLAVKTAAGTRRTDLRSNARTLETDVLFSTVKGCHVDKPKVHKTSQVVEWTVLEAHGLIINSMHSGLPQQTASQSIKRNGVGLQSVLRKPGRVCESEAWQEDAITARQVANNSVGARLGAGDCTACRAAQC